MAKQTDKQMQIILKGKDATAKAFKSMKRNGKESIDALKKGFGVLKGAVLGLEVAILGAGVMATKKMLTGTMQLAKSAVLTAGEFEKLRVQFGVLVGDVEKGNKIFDELWDTAKKIPFTIDEIARSAKIFKAWGAMGDDVNSSMLAIADASALAGVNMEMMATVIGRAYQSGTLLTRGPGALLKGLMMTKLGIDDISKLSLPEFRKALTKLLTDPSVGLAGMAQKLAGTFVGIRSMIGDAITNIKLSLAEAGLFDTVKEFMEDMRIWLLSEPILKRVREIGKIAGDVVGDLKKKFQEMVATGQLNDLLDQWVAGIKTFANTLKTLISNLPAIAKIVMNMVQSFIGGMNKIIQGVGKVVEVFEKVNNAIDGSSGGLERLREKAQEGQEELAVLAEHQMKLQKAMGKGEAPGFFFISDFITAIKKAGFETEDFKGEIAGLRQVFNEYKGTDEGTLGRQIVSNKLYEKTLSTLSRIQAQKQDSLGIDMLALKNAQKNVGLGEKIQKMSIDFNGTLEDLVIKVKEFENKSKGTASAWSQIKNGIADTYSIFTGKESQDALTMMDKMGAKMKKIFIGEKERGDPLAKGREVIRNTTQMWEEYLKKVADVNKKISDITTATAKTMAGSMENLFFDVLVGEFKGLREYVNQFLRDMARIIAQQLAMKAVMGMGTGMIPSPATAGAGGTAGFQHGGIISGKGGVDNVPIMASAGEMMLNKQQQKNLFDMVAKGKVGSTVNITNNISAMDGADAYRTFEKNSDAMLAVINKGMVNNQVGARR